MTTSTQQTSTIGSESSKTMAVEPKPLMVFFCAKARYSQILDYVGADDLSEVTRKTAAELAIQYGGEVEVLEVHEAIARTEQLLTTAPVEIKAEDFDYLLNVLPPCKWVTRGSRQAFHISERVNYSIVTWCVKISDRYFKFDATYRMTSDAAISTVLAVLPVLPEPSLVVIASKEDSYRSLVKTCAEMGENLMKRNSGTGRVQPMALHYKRCTDTEMGVLCLVFEGTPFEPGFELAAPDSLPCGLPYDRYFSWVYERCLRLPILASAK